MVGEVMRHYVIYFNPLDFPEHYVTRGCTIEPNNVRMDALPMAVVPTLEEARRVVPRGLHRIERMPGDDPSIREVWI